LSWNSYIKGYNSYLKLEKALSQNSIDAYLRDIKLLKTYFEDNEIEVAPEKVSYQQLQKFVTEIFQLGLSDRSQARIISGIRGFYNYLLLEDLVESNPTLLLDSPKLSKKLPQVLSYTEIVEMINCIDHSKPEGMRNRAIIETMYSCGLRVSELITLPISHLYLSDGFIKVMGKGSKERLVPIGAKAIKHIEIYVEQVRCHVNIQKGMEDILFLNRRGKGLSRVMVFMIVKDLAAKAGLEKKVSPHTFRHSFATHLVEGGANLKAVQDMLGHSSITTTEIYTHLDKTFLKETLMQYHPMSDRQ